MDTLYKTLEKGGIGIIESPTGTVSKIIQSGVISRAKRLVYCAVPLHGFIQHQLFQMILCELINHQRLLPLLQEVQ